MRFAQPHFIALFLATCTLIIFYAWSFRIRRKVRERFAQRELLPELLTQVNPKRQMLRAACLVTGIFFCLVAWMRPQWGFRWQEVKRRGLDIIIAVDTSKSMLASDIKPNRLERAKLAIRDFAQNLKGDRIGLVAFAGSAFLECPLTVDYGGFLLSLENVDTGTIPKGGTFISGAIKEAMRSFPTGEKKSKVLVIITDGEDHEGDPVLSAEEAKKEGVIIFCIGIGTREGELIFVDEQGGDKEFLKDSQGNAVKSRLNEEVLQKIALTTGGMYIRSTSAEFGLDLLYRKRLSAMEKSDFESKMNKFYEERYQIFLALGLLLILTETLISEKDIHRVS